jgi:hypothetical protein
VKILIKMMALQIPSMNPMISQKTSQRTHLYFAEIEHVVGKN